MQAITPVHGMTLKQNKYFIISFWYRYWNENKAVSYVVFKNYFCSINATDLIRNDFGYNNCYVMEFIPFW